MAIFHSFLWLNNIALCIYIYIYTHTHTHTHTHIYIYTHTTIHSSVDGHLGCFHVLAIVNSAAINIGVHVSFQIRVFIFSGYMSRSGIAGSYGNTHDLLIKPVWTAGLLCFRHSAEHCGEWKRCSPWSQMTYDEIWTHFSTQDKIWCYMQVV